MTPEPRPCLCGCGQTFARPKSLPLCKAGSDRAWALMKQIPLLDEMNAASRRSYRFWSSAETVAAALAADRLVAVAV